VSGQITVPTPGSVLQGPILSDFEPQLNLIQNVTTSANAVVTTVTDHNYTTGMFVRVIVPRTYGMEVYAQTEIVVNGTTTFETTINTLSLDSFVAPTLYPPVAFTPAQVIPITGVEDNIATI
jgi:hypothetical protein